jgi:hypothetical protein
MTTNRTREFFDFAQSEPLAIDDMASQLRECSEEEIEHIEQTASNALAAITISERNGQPILPEEAEA